MVEALNDIDDEVECVWCHEVYPKDDCKKEKNMGYLCDKCQRAIKSRGEDLEFEETEIVESKDVPVVDCLVNDVITHSEDEKPLDCENEKKPLEKPLTESEDEEPLHYHCDSCGNDFDVFGGKAFRCMYCNSLHINQLDEAADFNPDDPANDERDAQADEWIDPLDVEFPEADDDRYYDDDAEDFDRANVEAEKKNN